MNFQINLHYNELQNIATLPSPLTYITKSITILKINQFYGFTYKKQTLTNILEHSLKQSSMWPCSRNLWRLLP